MKKTIFSSLKIVAIPIVIGVAFFMLFKGCQTVSRKIGETGMYNHHYDLMPLNGKGLLKYNDTYSPWETSPFYEGDTVYTDDHYRGIKSKPDWYHKNGFTIKGISSEKHHF